MKRIIVLACALALGPIASAQLYKYVDKNGKTVYTDQPPPEADPKAMRIPSAATGSTAAPGKTYVQQDKDQQKGREKVSEGAKKADEAAARAKEAEQRCIDSRSAYEVYAQGGRIARVNEKGEREYMGDEQIDAAREKARAQMEQDCKK
jgi:hypothetical protein